MTPLAIALGIAVGFALGAFGAGGSILTVPLLVYALGLDVHSATGTSLLIVGFTAAGGTLLQARKRVVQWRDVLIFAVAGSAAAVLGAMLNHRLPGAVILLGLATLMLLVAFRMWRGRSASTEAGERRGIVMVLAVAGTVGLLTGLFGVGGGFLLVPALVLALGLSMTAAVATSLPVIAFNSAAGMVPYVAAGHIDYSLAALFIAGSLAGIALGTRAGERVGNAHLREAFAALMVLVAGYLVVQQASFVIA